MLNSPADLNDLNQLTKIAMRSEPKVLEHMAEYAGAYAQSGVAVAKSFIYRTHAVTFNSAAPDETQRSLATPRRSVAPSPGVCQRAPAFVFLEGLGLRLSASAAEARRRYSQLCEEEGWEVRVPGHLRQQLKARRFPPGACPPPTHRSSAAVVGGGVQRR